MKKKEIKNEEACSCTNCDCGTDCKCGTCFCVSKICIAILAIIGCLAAIMARVYSYKTYNLNVISAWGKENFEKMNDLYKSDAFIKYATERTDATVNGITNEYGTVDTEEDATENNPATSDDVKTVVENILSTSPIRWDANARYTILEYTELLCPFCQRHAENGTIEATIEAFPWEVNSVSKHFIIHGEEALALANAMECVAELNPEAYYDVFEKWFEAYPVAIDTLIDIASENWVDKSALQACVDEWRYNQSIEDMMSQASQLFGVNWTPWNVIIDRETGKFEAIPGAYPVDAFVEAINSMKNA